MLLNIFSFLQFSLIDVVDILMVAVIIYFLYKWIRGSSAMNIFLAIIILIITRVVAQALDMKMMSSLLGALLDVGVIALIVIFQPEIRRFLENIGRSAGMPIGKRRWLEKLFPNRNGSALGNGSLAELSEAVEEMASTKTGALIVILRREGLEDIIASGDRIDAEIRSRLVQNIFFKNSPLHDGAMIIGGDRIIAARCTLPISDRIDLPAKYGMRHKAAIGLSERSDASVIVVSEQTGKISFVSAGKIDEIKSINFLKLCLQGEYDGTKAGK